MAASATATTTIPAIQMVVFRMFLSFYELQFGLRLYNNSKAIFKRGKQRVRMIGGLIHSQEQVASRRRIAHHEVRIKRASSARCWRWRRGAAKDGRRATRHRIGDWRSIRSRAHAAHILRHRGSLIILVVPLLIVILDAGSEILGQLVLEDDANIVQPVDGLRII